jgi:uncharacterized membrane protein
LDVIIIFDLGAFSLSSSLLYVTAAYELTEKEKKIIDYVRNEPGITKQGVVNYSNGLYSRKTVYKNLHILIEEYRMIVVRKESDSPSIHQRR